MFPSRFMPCSECGASVERGETGTHRCDDERLLDYRMFGLREGIALLEDHLHAHLDSSTGRFEVWLASRDVRRQP